ncbi:hypothetical protein JCM8097_003848 [Rhodosporidiobolus ruineniae]
MPGLAMLGLFARPSPAPAAHDGSAAAPPPLGSRSFNPLNTSSSATSTHLGKRARSGDDQEDDGLTDEDADADGEWDEAAEVELGRAVKKEDDDGHGLKFAPPLPPRQSFNRNGMPNREAFEHKIDAYLSTLHPAKKRKALVDAEMRDLVIRILADPLSKLGDSQTRFWARRRFTTRALPAASTSSASSSSSSSAGAGDDAPPSHELIHDSRRVVVREDMYDILSEVHAATNHGGRDKTFKAIKLQYCYIPKELASDFVKLCRKCNTAIPGAQGGGRIKSKGGRPRKHPRPEEEAYDYDAAAAVEEERKVFLEKEARASKELDDDEAMPDSQTAAAAAAAARNKGKGKEAPQPKPAKQGATTHEGNEAPATPAEGAQNGGRAEEEQPAEQKEQHEAATVLTAMTSAGDNGTPPTDGEPSAETEKEGKEQPTAEGETSEAAVPATAAETVQPPPETAVAQSDKRVEEEEKQPGGEVDKPEPAAVSPTLDDDSILPPAEE